MPVLSTYRLTARKFTEERGYILTELLSTKGSATVQASTFAQLETEIAAFGTLHAPCNVWVMCADKRKPRGFDTWNRGANTHLFYAPAVVVAPEAPKGWDSTETPAAECVRCGHARTKHDDTEGTACLVGCLDGETECDCIGFTVADPRCPAEEHDDTNPECVCAYIKNAPLMHALTNGVRAYDVEEQDATPEQSMPTAEEQAEADASDLFHSDAERLERLAAQRAAFVDASKATRDADAFTAKFDAAAGASTEPHAVPDFRKVHALIPQSNCPFCLAFAIVPLTPAQRLAQPDDTTHVCHPLLGGCNQGFTDSRSR